MRAVKDALAEIIQPDAIEPWLNTPNAKFNGRTPKQAVEEGEADQIIQAAGRIAHGILD